MGGELVPVCLEVELKVELRNVANRGARRDMAASCGGGVGAS